jgi:ABC-2 type transport system ATP-binding protein
MNDPAAVPLLQLKQVSRQTAGRQIVRQLDLTLRRGEVLGLLGVNGAGKSTTLRMIAGVLSPSAGHVCLDGEDLYDRPDLARTRIGYLPERAPLYNELTVTEFLRFCARLRGLDRAASASAVTRELARCELDDVRDRLIGALSRGYQQRVGIAQAVLHSPALIVLDEPASGLDPVQAVRMRALIAALRDAGHAVVLSTHQLNEVESSCDRVAILHRGELRDGGLEGDTLEQRFLRVAADGNGP